MIPAGLQGQVAANSTWQENAHFVEVEMHPYTCARDPLKRGKALAVTVRESNQRRGTF